MQVYYTRDEGFMVPVSVFDDHTGVTPVTPDSAERIGLIPRMPFVLCDDGAYHPYLNRFLRSLPATGCPSPNTWKAYAQDIVTFALYLRTAKVKDLLEAEVSDVFDYKIVRRRRQQAQSWNRSLAALENFYDWAVSEGLMAKPPFPSRYETEVQTPHGNRRMKRSRLRDSVDATASVRFVSPEDLKFFVDVGIRGLLPDGREDPAFERRTAFRNYVMTRFLVATGLRIEEASALLVWELPPVPSEQLAASKTVKLRVPKGIAKRGREREVVVSASDYLLLREYIEVERQNLLDRFSARGRGYPPVANPIRVGRSNRQYRLLDREGRPTRSIDAARPEDRIRFIEDVDGVSCPVWIWLDHETGAPLGTRAWNDVFLVASARCRAFGREIHVTPHMLRHSFAVSYLSHLIEANLGRAKLDDLTEPGNKIYRRLYLDPLRILQLRLGHRNITTTFRYLDYLREAREIADQALLAWENQMGWDEP